MNFKQYLSESDKSTKMASTSLKKSWDKYEQTQDKLYKKTVDGLTTTLGQKLIGKELVVKNNNTDKFGHGEKFTVEGIESVNITDKGSYKNITVKFDNGYWLGYAPDTGETMVYKSTPSGHVSRF